MKRNPIDGAMMVWIPAGEFLMGSKEDATDNPPRRVYLSGYWIYKNLVTVAQYRKFCQATGRQMPDAPRWGWKNDHPIVNVTWHDAKAYCDWAGVLLPTEAQWEKAARGTDGRKFPWGNEFDWSRLRASKASFGDAGSTAPVGSYPSGGSPYGILDMAGNVWQWCSDWKAAPKSNLAGPAYGKLSMLRGGSWSNETPVYFRSSIRYWHFPANRGDNYGFRCASPSFPKR